MGTAETTSCLTTGSPSCIRASDPSSDLTPTSRTTDDLVVDGDGGAFRFTITGRHNGDLPGYPETGNTVDISGAMFFRLDRGKVLHAYELINHDSMRGISLR